MANAEPIPSTLSYSLDSEILKASFNTPCPQPYMQPQRAHIQTIHTHHSGEFTSPHGRFCKKVSTFPFSVFFPSDLVKNPLASEEYIAHSQISLAAAQNRVFEAKNNLIKKRYEEYHALIKIREGGGDLTMLDPRTSLTLSRLARATLASEYYLSVCKRDACKQELIILENTVDEGLV